MQDMTDIARLVFWIRVPVSLGLEVQLVWSIFRIFAALMISLPALYLLARGELLALIVFLILLALPAGAPLLFSTPGEYGFSMMFFLYTLFSVSFGTIEGMFLGSFLVVVTQRNPLLLMFAVVGLVLTVAGLYVVDSIVAAVSYLTAVALVATVDLYVNSSDETKHPLWSGLGMLSCVFIMNFVSAIDVSQVPEDSTRWLFHVRRWASSILFPSAAVLSGWYRLHH